MDRTTVIGFVLIAIVLMVWIWMNSPTPQQQKNVSNDSISTSQNNLDTLNKSTSPPISSLQTEQDSLGKYFSPLIAGQADIYKISTDVINAEISSRGGAITSWELKKYSTWNGYTVNLINRDNTNNGDFNLLFYTSDGKLINTKNLQFKPLSNINRTSNLSNKDSLSIDFALSVSPKSKILKSYTFYKDKYFVNVTYKFEEMDSIISNYEYQVVWETGLNYQERNSVDESSFAMAYSYAGGELTEIDASSVGEPPVRENISGLVKWVASRNKYFGIAILPQGIESRGAYLEGVNHKLPDNGTKEYYHIGIKTPYLGRQSETSRFTLFLGPLDFDLVKSFNVDLDQIMSLGAVWIIRPISEFIMIPLFKFLHLFIPNYGIVIIIFSFIIKITLHPLTKSSMTSMKKMQSLQPMIEEIKEKHKEDPQKMNMQVMRLYKEYGVNPAGGCLPMLLQMPILYALWSVFQSTIELRQASFVGWITDLSIPDVIAKLPIALPLFNITEVSGLSLLMGITMFVQQKMTVKDPRQKMMIWLMPILMTLLFNSFPSGLNLYYFIFNLLSIGQQYWITKQHKDKPPQKVQPKKSGSLFSYLTKALPKLK